MARKKHINENNFVKKFTNKEAYKILKDLICEKKANHDTYKLILLWITGVFNNASYAHLKNLSNGVIITHDINKNTDEIIGLVHDLIIELTYTKVTDSGHKVGLMYKVSWDAIPIRDKETKEIKEYKHIEGNEGMIVSFINRAFRIALFKCLSRSFRGDINYSSIHAIKVSKRMEKLRERMIDEIDTAITTPELIEKLLSEGFDEVTIFQYRLIYSLGIHRNYCDMSEDTINKGSIFSELTSLTNTDNLNKLIYEQMCFILNSEEMPRVYREFLKCYYQIPSQIGRKVFVPDMVLFFEMYPDYKTILRVERISYRGKRRNIKWVDNIDMVKETELYKTSHAMIRFLLRPLMEKVQVMYDDNIRSALDILGSFDVQVNLNADSDLLCIGDNYGF